MPEHETRPVHLAPGEGATVKNPTGGSLTFKVRGEDTGGSLTVFESTVAPGEGPPLHVHAHLDEVWYALEGTFRVKLEDEVQDAPYSIAWDSQERESVCSDRQAIGGR